MRRHILLSRSRRHHTLAHNINASHQPLHASIVGHHRLPSMLIPGRATSVLQGMPVGAAVSRPGGISIADEDVIHRSLQTSRFEKEQGHPQGDAPPIPREVMGSATAYGRGVPLRAPLPNIDTPLILKPTSQTASSYERGVGESYSGNEEGNMIPLSDVNIPVPEEAMRIEDIPSLPETALDEPLYEKSFPEPHSVYDEGNTVSEKRENIVSQKELQERIPMDVPVMAEQEQSRMDASVMEEQRRSQGDAPPIHKDAPNVSSYGRGVPLRAPLLPQTRPHPKRGRIVERPTDAKDAQPVPDASKVTPPTASSKNANMYRTNEANAPRPQATEADELFTPRTTDRSPQWWAARLFKTAQSEQTQNESSTSVADEMAEKREQQSAVSTPTAQQVTSQQVSPRKDASNQQASYVAPKTEQTRFIAPLPQIAPSAPIELSQHTRAFLRPLVGIDPANVSVYQDTAAEHVTTALNADAVVLRADTIALAPEHRPDTPETLGLLAHELTHVARRQAPHFIPPIVRPVGNTPSFITPHVIPIVDAESSATAGVTDEEAVAEGVEQAVLQAAQRQDASMVTTQLPHSANSVEIVNYSQSSSSENIMWGGLPAPWEPLPDWLAMPAESVPLSPSSANTFPQSQIGLYQRSEATNFGNSELAHTTQSMGNGNMVEDIGMQRAGLERTLEQEDMPTPSASTPVQAPEPDLDALARQVYSVLKRRLEVEYRRSQ